MPDAPKLYRAQLRSAAPEEWTQDEHDAVQKMTGDRFSEYIIEPIQPVKPAGDVQTSKTKTKDADAPAA